MADEQDTQADPGYSRSLNVHAYGNNMDELELDALDKAREFFGPDTELRICPNYVAHLVEPNSSFRPAAAGRRYRATVRVHDVQRSGT